MTPVTKKLRCEIRNGVYMQTFQKLMDVREHEMIKRKMIIDEIEREVLNPVWFHVNDSYAR
jgi:hypothetical protein